jgi:hypothetical protein
MSWNKSLYNSLDFLNMIIERIETYPYLSYDLRIGASLAENIYSWNIAKSINYALAEPHKMFFRWAEENPDGIMIMRDMEDSIIDIVNEIYGVYLYDNLEFNEESWSKPEMIEKLRKKYPKAFEFIDKRAEAANRISTKHKVEIRDIIDETGYSYIELRYNVKKKAIKDKVSLFMQGMDILREIYKEIYNVDDAQQEFDIQEKGDIEFIKTSLYTIRKIINELHTLIPTNIEIDNWPIEGGRNIFIRLENRKIGTLEIEIHEIEETEQPIKYKITGYIELRKKHRTKIENSLSKIIRYKERKPLISIEEQHSSLYNAINQVQQIIKTIEQNT